MGPQAEREMEGQGGHLLAENMPGSVPAPAKTPVTWNSQEDSLRGS